MTPTVTPTVVIPRVAPRRTWARPDCPLVDLVLPLDPAGYGCIAVWDAVSGHAEASCDYYAETRAPRTPAEREAAERAVASYPHRPVIVRQRRPAGWRRHAWVTSF